MTGFPSSQPLGRSAVIICDMWNDHHWVSAARRVAEMAPHMNAVVTRLRDRGALIVHAPIDCVGFYDGSPARQRAIQAPRAPAPVPFDWNDWEDDEKGKVALTLTDPRSDGQEIFNLLEQRALAHVIVMGVHTNICVLARPYGIRQLVRLGKQPVLCRDLTDSFRRYSRGHDWGTDHVIAHIEARWCPTVTSDELVGVAPFRFRERD